jgi:hypothetical protein
MSSASEGLITEQKRGPAGAFGVAVRLLGSMKLSVWLLLILAALTWLGTLAQVGRSLFDVQREYFESWFVFAKLPVALWGWEPVSKPLVIPLPGAYPVMGLLFVNLLVGGLLRMKWNGRNAGILITHLGIALLLVAGFVKMHYSYAGNMALFEAPADGRPMGRAHHEVVAVRELPRLRTRLAARRWLLHRGTRDPGEHAARRPRRWGGDPQGGRPAVHGRSESLV